MNSGIYKIINTISGRYYVGSSKNIARRWKKHRYDLSNGSHHNEHLHRAWMKYGENNFIFMIVEEVSEDELHTVEQKYLDICRLNPEGAYNMNYTPDGGCPSIHVLRKISNKLRGRKLSQEHRQKIGQANLGRRCSDETRIKIGIASSRRKHTQASRDKIGESLCGRVHSDTTKLKIRNSNIGRHNHSGEHNPNFDCVVRGFFHEQSGKVFVGRRFEFIKQCGISPSMVSEMVCGKRETSKGWRLADRSTRLLLDGDIKGTKGTR